MIDDEQDVYDLIKAMNEHLPMPAYATPPLVKAVRRANPTCKDLN